MKKKLFACLSVAMLTLWGACLAGDPVGLEIYGPLSGTASTCILPPAALEQVQSWTVASNTIAAGSVWLAANGRKYLSMHSGIATNSPTNGIAGLTDAMLWLPVNDTLQHRKGLAVYNTGTGHVYAAFDKPAVSGKGIYLPPNGGSLVISGDAPQGSLHVISVETGSVVTAQTW
jgi:hypothetical protein